MSQNKNKLVSRRRLAMELLRTVARDLRRYYIIFFFATVVFSASSFLLPQYFLYFTENAAKISEITFDAFLPKFFIFGAIIAVILFLTTLGSNYMREWFQLKIERYLRSKVLRRLHDLSITEIDRVQRGDWLTRITGDLRSVESFVAESLPQQLRSFLILIGTGALFIFYSRSMAAVPILACLVIAAINVWVQKRILPLIDEIRDLHGDVAQTLLQSLEGIKTIRSYNAQDDQTKRFSHQLIAVESKGLKVARYFGFLIGSNDAATQILTTFSLTFIMIVLSKGEMTLAAALAYPFYLNLFYSSAEFLAASSLEWNEFFVSGGRFAEITNEEVKQDNKALSIDPSILSSVKNIDVWGVSFGYFRDAPLKNNFQFSCRKNEMAVILGPSGAGKSTFLEVLSGIRQPFSGHWQLVTKVPGEEFSFADSQLPTQLAAYVEQKPYIFEGTLRDNLLLGEGKSVSSIWEALTEANAADFVKGNGGLDYFLRDGGQNLSEGQRYRIALARALLRKRPFLLLDEPFAALDRINAELIAQTLNSLKAHCGIVIVSHFIPNSLRPDRIIDFEGMPSNLFEAIPQMSDLRDRVIAHKSNNIF